MKNVGRLKYSAVYANLIFIILKVVIFYDNYFT